MLTINDEKAWLEIFILKKVYDNCYRLLYKIENEKNSHIVVYNDFIKRFLLLDI